MTPENLIGSLIRGALGVRRKRSGRTLRYLTRDRGSLVNASTLLGAAGVAWGIYEAATRSASGDAPTPGPPPLPAGAPPLPASASGAPPPLPSAPGLSPEVLRLVRLTISAARADSTLSAEERDEILRHAREVGAESVVEAELESPVPLARIVAGVHDPQLKAALYVLAFSLVRADEDVTGAERIYLAQLAHGLGLEPEATARLEAETAARIEEEEGQG